MDPQMKAKRLALMDKYSAPQFASGAAAVSTPGEASSTPAAAKKARARPAPKPAPPRPDPAPAAAVTNAALNAVKSNASGNQPARSDVALSDSLAKILHYLGEQHMSQPSHRREVSSAELQRETGVDLGDDGLREELARHNRILIKPNGTYMFKPIHNISSKSDIVDLIGRQQNGLRTDDLKMSYRNVDEDVKELVRTGRVIMLRNADRKPAIEVLYPAELDCRVHVDSDIQRLWRQVPETMPRPKTADDIIKLLADFKLPFMRVEDAVAVKVDEEPQKRRKKRTKIANTHLAPAMTTPNVDKKP